MDDRIRRLLSNDEPTAYAETESWLRTLPRAEAVSAVGAMCTDPEAKIRATVATIAGQHFQEVVERAVVPLLDDSQGFVRWAACEAALWARCTGAAPLLTRLVAADPEPTVRNMAALAAGAVGDLSVVPALRAAAAAESGKDHEGRSIRDVILSSIAQISRRHSGRP